MITNNDNVWFAIQGNYKHLKIGMNFTMIDSEYDGVEDDDDNQFEALLVEKLYRMPYVWEINNWYTDDDDDNDRAVAALDLVYSQYGGEARLILTFATTIANTKI